MKSMHWLLAAVFALMLAACGGDNIVTNVFNGGGGDDGSSSGNFVLPPATENVVKLVRAVQLPDRRWEYEIMCNMFYVTGNQSAFGYIAEWNNWAVANGWMDAGWLHFKVVSWNRDWFFTFFGNPTNSWVDPRSSAFNSSVNNNFYILLKDGQMYLGQDYVPARPVAAGDEYVGFQKEGNNIRVYFNLNKMPFNAPPIGAYWSCSAVNNRQRQPIFALNSDGWASVLFTPNTFPKVFEFSYGAVEPNNGQEFLPDVAAQPSQWVYYNNPLGLFRAKGFADGGFAPTNEPLN